MLNVHHLELFYYVARAGGLSPAVRQIPYGIQQPAVSRQLMLLEKEVREPLFERRPFRLTRTGENLYASIKPFFDALKDLPEAVRTGAPDVLRMASSPIVLREYFPSIFRSLRPAFPKLRVTLKEGLQFQIHQWLQAREVDLAVTMLEGAPPRDCLAETLLRLPMVLLVEEASELRSAAALWRRRHIEEVLICPTPEDATSRCFRQGLHRLGINWDTGMEVNSIELVEAYVANGCGIGISMTVPGRKLPPGLRALPLRDFPSIQFGMLWRRHPNRVICALLIALRRAAKRAQEGLKP